MKINSQMMTTKVGAVTRMLYQLGSGTDCDGEDNSDKRTELLLSASSCKKNTTAGCLPCRNSSPAIDARRMIVVPTSDVEVDDTLGRKEAGRREGRRKEGGLEPQPTLYQHHVQFPNPAALAGLNAANSRNTPSPRYPPPPSTPWRRTCSASQRRVTPQSMAALPAHVATLQTTDRNGASPFLAGTGWIQE